MIFLSIFLACGDSQKDDDTSSPNTSNTSGNLSDLTQGLSKNPDCWGSYTSDGNPYCVPGATGYWYGTFNLTGTSEGDQATGTEKWILLSNDTWTATDEGGDCEVVWTVVGNVTAPGACATCQMGLSLTASINRGATTCPQGVWAGEETMQESYNVYLGNDGSSIWYFGWSGFGCITIERMHSTPRDHACTHTLTDIDALPLSFNFFPWYHHFLSQPLEDIHDGDRVQRSPLLHRAPHPGAHLRQNGNQSGIAACNARVQLRLHATQCNAP